MNIAAWFLFGTLFTIANILAFHAGRLSERSEAPSTKDARGVASKRSCPAEPRPREEAPSSEQASPTQIEIAPGVPFEEDHGRRNAA